MEKHELQVVIEDLHQRGKTIIMVTHDPSIAKLTSRVIRLRDGELESDVRQ